MRLTPFVRGEEWGLSFEKEKEKKKKKREKKKKKGKTS